ncbi:MAG: DUF2950 family protein [Rubrivivax sp.]|nr:DUF2950 family protein [Rubrivivax sp.]MBP6462536.1 DUF2950 family protein [Rubrivivax sp.]MBP9908417.1 DUF2950 family protein [Rubrivivax sp.]
MPVGAIGHAPCGRLAGGAGPLARHRRRPAAVSRLLLPTVHCAGAPCARGAYDCIVKGHQIGGFALLAWPAQWGVSGIMTFIVNHDGVVHSRNFGAQTGSANLDCKPRIGPPAWTALKESLAGAAAHVAPGGQLRDDLQWRHRQVHRAVARGHRPA